jgi:flagellar basal-body rod protein FlgB
MIEKILSTPSYDGSKVLLDVSLQKQGAIASNIANLETPGFKRIELDRSFTTVFAEALRAGNPAQVSRPVLTTDLNSPAQRKDGNNVVLQDELMAMGKNAVEYDALSEFVSYSMRIARMAISGRSQP